jgi:glycosyltransferase involved in cell wall biosynthesis
MDMRILKITQAYHPFWSRGGPAVKVRSIARELVRQGHAVTVLTADLGFGSAEIALAGAFRNGHGWRSNLDDVETVYLPTQCCYRNVTVNAGVIRFCRRRLRDFEIVHVYGLYDALGPVVARFCRQYEVPYIVEPLGMTRPIDRGFLLKKAWRRLVGPYLSDAYKMIATSNQEREELLEDGFASNRVVLRHNGIDLEEFRSVPPSGTFRAKAGLRDGERYILFLGRVIPRKGADLLIEALPQLSDQTGPTGFSPARAKLVIAGPEGESGYLAFLRAKARSLQVGHRVAFTGPLYGDDKKAALAGADVFVLPSRYENFGNTAAEAIACGTPAIVTDRCGIAPIINGRAGLVTTYDSGAVARMLNDLLENENLYQRLKAGCPQVAGEISWDGLVREMQSLYAEAKDFLRRPSV